MKTAFKWLGWGLLGLIAIAVLSSAEPLTRWGIALSGLIYFLFTTLEKQAEARRKALDYRLTVLEQKIDSILNHPLNTLGISETVEEIVAEYRKRKRTDLDAWPAAPLSGEWPFGKRG
jgi:hypothetical protein